MSNFHLDLSFADPFDKGFPANPIAKILINNLSSDKFGKTFVSQECVTYTELEFQANELIKELENIKKKAKKKFDKAR